jgi:hypothetical protein
VETVTGRPFKSELLKLAERIIDLCDGHTCIVACAATEIAKQVISARELYSSQSAQELALSDSVRRSAPSML